MKHNRYSTLIIQRCLLALVLAMLIPLFHASGQGNRSLGLGASLKSDTVLINQYIRIQKNGGISSDSSFKLEQAALMLAKKHGLQKKTGYVWNLIAWSKMRAGNFADCKLYLDSAFRINEILKDGELTCILNATTAGMYQYSSNYAKAALHYFRAVEAVQEYKIGNTRPGVALYINLSGLMTQLNEDSLARKYMLLAKYHALRMQPVDSSLLTVILLGIGKTYLKLDSSASIGYYKDAYKLSKKINSTTYSFQILINLSRTYLVQKQYDSADHYLQLAKPFATPGRDTIISVEVAGLIAAYRKDYPKAITYLQTALDMTQGEDHEFLDEIYEGLSEVYAACKQYQKAYEFHEKYMEHYRKKMEDPKKTVTDFMLNFQSLEHEKRIIQKQAEITAKETDIKRRNLWIGAMCVLSALLLIILAMAFRNYRHRKNLLNERMQSLLRDQEIERLKAEAEGADKERVKIAYDLHDGVMIRLANVKMNLNALPAFPGFAGNNRYPDIIGQLDLASQELRNTAHNLMPEILLEDGLAQAIFYFCKATEQASGLTIKFQQVGDPLPRLQTQVETAVYRIAQGLIQNVIRHAQATTALVQLQYSDHLCAITVEDNGRGIADVKSSEGYGLKSIRNRIKVLHGTFDIESDQGRGTTAYLDFDIRPFL